MGNVVNIIVCMKQVIDPEAPISGFSISPETKRATLPKGTPPVLSPFDENALEAALRIKDIKDIQESNITVISLGQSFAMSVVKKSLAAGADELLLLQDDAFEALDAYSTAHALSAAIKKIGKYDLVLTGRQAADWDAGQVGSGIAEILGIPCITVAQKIETVDGRVRVERVVSDGYEVIEATMPALVTVSNELGDLRYVTIQGIVAAKKKPITIWKAEDLKIDPSKLRRISLQKLFIPIREEKCELVGGETLEEAGENLAMKLRQIKII
jgi:electron transfer flavoprotein beta subunit